MRSMTGFGRSTRDARGLRALVEVRSVNQKGLDIKVRLPRDAAALEAEIVSHVKACVERGRVEVHVELVALDSGHADAEAVQRLVNQARGLAIALDVRADLSVGDLMRTIMAVRGEAPAFDVHAAQPAVLIALDDALGALLEARGAEGKALAAVVEQRLEAVQELTAQLAERTKGAPARLAEKLQARVHAAGVKLDEARLAQECALLADRVDVSEELERLAAHVQRGRALASSPSGAGRQLDFLCQELLREANTLGSKVQDAAASHLVVDLKSEIERLREQVQNIE